MQELTIAADQAVENLAQRYHLSVDAVRTLLHAVSAGGGTMAQFYHPELGGSGQWMQGGMTMVGDMFNQGLKATVSNLCMELSTLLSQQEVFVVAPPHLNGPVSIGHGNWWPADLGMPTASGSQNECKYAYFAGARRLAVDRGGQLTVYDTLDHNISGVQQQQGGYSGTLSFSSQFGTFPVDTLPMVSPPPLAPPELSRTSTSDQYPAPHSASFPQAPISAHFNAAPSYAQVPPSSSYGASGPSSSRSPSSQTDTLAAIERLGDLHQKGILSDEEFRTKKAELLSRL